MFTSTNHIAVSIYKYKAKILPRIICLTSSASTIMSSITWIFLPFLLSGTFADHHDLCNANLPI